MRVNMLSSEKPGAACRNRSHTLEGPDFLCKHVDLGKRGEGGGGEVIPAWEDRGLAALAHDDPFLQVLSFQFDPSGNHCASAGHDKDIFL